MPRILLVEYQDIVRSGIKILLEKDDAITIAAETTNSHDALKLLEGGINVDVILTEIALPDLDGIIFIREIVSRFPLVKVLVLSAQKSNQYIFEAFQAGAVGYLLKNIKAYELLFALKHVSYGDTYLCTELTAELLDRVMYKYQISTKNASSVEFSGREIEVLNLIAEGLTNIEIADRLFISKRTIEGHRQSLIEKTGVRNTATLIKYAVLNGIIQ